MQISGVSAGYGQAYGMNQAGRKPPSMEEKFSEVDSDGSGGVSFEEFSTDIQAMQDKMSQEGMPPPPGGGQGGPSEMSSEEMEELFNDADSDGDGTLTSEEFSTHMESLRPDPGVMQQMSSSTNSTEDDMTEALLEMMDSVNENNEQSSVSAYADQLLQAYGLNSSEQTSSTTSTSSSSTSSTVSSQLSVSA